MDDEQLTTHLARDLDGTFEALVLHHQDRLYSVALRLLGDAHDAEEVAQDAFVRAYRALGMYDRERIGSLRLRAWLSTIVVNLVRNRTRGQHLPSVSIELEGVAPVAEEAAGPETIATRREEGDRWAALLGSLPDRYRIPVVLRTIDELSYGEMANVLGRPEGTLKAQVHRGLALLRAAYEADERGHESGRTGGGNRTAAALDAVSRSRPTLPSRALEMIR